MALLGVVILGNLGGASIIRMIPSIARTLQAYAIVVVVAVGLPFLMNDIINNLSGNPMVNQGIATLLMLYFITAHARLLGIFYRKEAEKLNWF